MQGKDEKEQEVNMLTGILLTISFVCFFPEDLL